MTLEEGFKSTAYDVLLINDASTDNSVEITKNLKKIRSIHLPYNLGIGGCVQTGFKYATKYNYDIVVQFDADGQHLISEIPRLIKLISLDKADMVIGSRFLKNEQSSFKSTKPRRLGIRILNNFAMLLTKQKVTDCTSGFRAFNKEVCAFLATNYPIDFPEPEALVLLAKNQFRIKEVRTVMNERKGGKSSIPSGGAFYMVKVILGMIMTATRKKLITNGR